ncbi:5093_t:CDS:2, partial [Paraglomus occultum]
MSESKATTDFDDEDEYLYGTEEPAPPQPDAKENILIEKETDNDIYGSEFKDENNLNQIDQVEDIIPLGDKLPSSAEKLPQVELTDEIEETKGALLLNAGGYREEQAESADEDEQKTRLIQCTNFWILVFETTSFLFGQDIEIIMNSTPTKSMDNSNRPNALVNIKPNQLNKGVGNQRHDGGQQTGANRTPGIDLNAVGTIDGTSVYDVDLDSFEDKPWRKPGADITDYFNYGFNEHTWRAYCAKQKQMREEQHLRKRINVYESKPDIPDLPPELQSISQPSHGGDHSRFSSQRRGRRNRDQDDSVIQVVSSEREAALEEMEPIPPPNLEGSQTDEYTIEDNDFPQNFA